MSDLGKLPIPTNEMQAADHIEMDHERELAPGDTDLLPMHRQMHEQRTDWAHYHGPVDPR